MRSQVRRPTSRRSFTLARVAARNVRGLSSCRTHRSPGCPEEHDRADEPGQRDADLTVSAEARQHHMSGEPIAVVEPVRGRPRPHWPLDIACQALADHAGSLATQAHRRLEQGH